MKLSVEIVLLNNMDLLIQEVRCLRQAVVVQLAESVESNEHGLPAVEQVSEQTMDKGRRQREAGAKGSYVRQSMVDRFGEPSRVGMLIFPASDNQRDGPLAGPLMGDIDSAWPWFWLRSRNTRHCKK